MTIIDKPQLNFPQRLIVACKSQSLIPWFLGLFLLFAGVVYNDSVKGIVLIVFGTSYLALLAFWAYRIARTFIYKIEATEVGTSIHYLLNQKRKELVLSVNQNLFRTFDRSRYSLKQIHFLKNDKTIVKQYAFGPWKEEEIENLEKELKRIGFKKPYGENL